MKRSEEKAKETYDSLSKWYDIFFDIPEKKYKNKGIINVSMLME